MSNQTPPLINLAQRDARGNVIPHKLRNPGEKVPLPKPKTYIQPQQAIKQIKPQLADPKERIGYEKRRLEIVLGCNATSTNKKSQRTFVQQRSIGSYNAEIASGTFPVEFIECMEAIVPACPGRWFAENDDALTSGDWLPISLPIIINSSNRLIQYMGETLKLPLTFTHVSSFSFNGSYTAAQVTVAEEHGFYPGLEVKVLATDSTHRFDGLTFVVHQVFDNFTVVLKCSQRNIIQNFDATLPLQHLATVQPLDATFEPATLVVEPPTTLKEQAAFVQAASARAGLSWSINIDYQNQSFLINSTFSLDTKVFPSFFNNTVSGRFTVHYHVGNPLSDLSALAARWTRLLNPILFGTDQTLTVQLDTLPPVTVTVPALTEEKTPQDFALVLQDTLNTAFPTYPDFFVLYSNRSSFVVGHRFRSFQISAVSGALAEVLGFETAGLATTTSLSLVWSGAFRRWASPLTSPVRFAVSLEADGRLHLTSVSVQKRYENESVVLPGSFTRDQSYSFAVALEDSALRRLLNAQPNFALLKPFGLTSLDWSESFRYVVFDTSGGFDPLSSPPVVALVLEDTQADNEWYVQTEKEKPVIFTALLTLHQSSGLFSLQDSNFNRFRIKNSKDALNLTQINTVVSYLTPEGAHYRLTGGGDLLRLRFSI